MGIDVYKYCDEEYYKKEIDILKDELCVLAHASEFAEENYYKVLNNFGVSSFLRKEKDGEIQRYLNSCPHRFARLVDGNGGTDPIICKYHGLNFTNGKCKETLIKLPKNYCYDFIMSRNNSNLDTFNFFNTINPTFHRCIGSFKKVYACNWKVVVENTLESAHVPFVHPGFPKLDMSNQESKIMNGIHSLWEAPILDNDSRKGVNDLYEKNEELYGKYYILHLFPLTFISSLNGITSSIVSINPWGVGCTEVSVLVFMPKGKETKYQKLIDKSVMDSTIKIFNEDSGVCESVQDGLDNMFNAGLNMYPNFWNYEKRINNFHSAYNGRISGL